MTWSGQSDPLRSETALSLQSARRHPDQGPCRRDQDALGLRTSASATQGRTGVGSLRRTILDRTSPPCLDVDDGLRLPTVPKARSGGAEKKSPWSRTPNPPCRQCLRLSLTASRAHHHSIALTADAASLDTTVNFCQSSVRETGTGAMPPPFAVRPSRPAFGARRYPLPDRPCGRRGLAHWPDAASGKDWPEAPILRRAAPRPASARQACGCG